MKRIALALAFCLISLRAFAEMAAAPQIDCTEICGNPTCCIAETKSIAGCSVTDKSVTARLKALALQNKNDEIVNICVGETKTKGVNPIVPRKFGDRLRRACNWGCCETQSTLASLQKNPAMASKMFAGTTLASVGKEISDKGTITPEARKKIGRGMDGGFLCIFCCHF